MNKSDLADTLYRGLHGVATRAAAKQAVDDLLAAMAGALAAGEAVHLAGFGNLDLRVKGARAGTVLGRAFDRPAHLVVRFRAAKALADRLPDPSPDLFE